ncbi:GNAT family N-acetyltransferase [Paenibacillus aquistagni]|uniref:GNAT family N-acetyltransferase n=1 Tax=Paenibacillus aquistagni TaxID=1852522 RepID=UPI000B4FECB4|nr:GNAT family N-acetyltransferase [Paenibacillus aquistagni]
MEDNVRLIEPTADYRSEYLEMTTEWRTAGEKLIPWVLRFDSSNFHTMLQELDRLKHDSHLEEGKVNCSTFWLVKQDRTMLGAVNIRHRLNASLLEIGGHIGYGIRPSARRQGYATALLHLALREARILGIDKVLITCDKDNIGSARTIINNGGTLDSEYIVNGVEIQRYWIQNEWNECC